MRLQSQKYWISFLVLIALINITYSHENDTETDGRRNARVSGRIVKLYSGPKPDPVICLGEGFQKDAVDCSVFYRCLKAANGKYTVYRFQCGPGTVYDPETEICNHPRSTKRLECGGLAYDKLISSTEKYIENEIEGLQKENHELPSPITTKSPLKINAAVTTSKPNRLFNSYLSTSYPWITSSSQAYTEASITTTASPWHVPTSISTKNTRGYTSLHTTSHPIIQPNQRDNQCTSDGFIGDSEDCRKFYRCVNNQRGGFIRYEFSCSESTIWDDDTQGCNHAWAVKRRRCGKGSSLHQDGIHYGNKNPSNEPAVTHTIQQQTQISYGSKVSQSQVQISNKPARQNQTQINYGDSLNREKPIIKQNETQIAYGNAITQSQTQFDYGDKVTQSQLQAEHTYRPSQTQTQLAEIPLSSTTASTQYMKDISNNKCTRDGFIGDSNDCSKFYRCISNGKGGYNRYDFSCSEGTLWDEKLEACNHAWAVKECGTKILNENPTSIVTTIKAPNNYYTTTLSTLNNEIDDEVGYENQNNNKPDSEEQKPSSHTLSTSTTTESVQILESNCQASGFFGNVDDCTKFYRCVENGRGGYTKYEYKCGDGTVWDPEIESCNHAWTVKKCSSQKGSVNLQTSTESTIITTVSLVHSTTQTDFNSSYNSEQRETSLPSTSTTERILQQGSVCKSAGFMGDDKDCKKFYRCVENGNGQYNKYEFTCGEGTVWDPKIDACNHAWAVEECRKGSKKDHDQVTTTHSAPQVESEDDNGYNLPQDMSKDPELHPQSTTLSTIIHSTSAAPSEGKECKFNGFMGDKDDCKIFYRCVENGNGGFTRYEFSCGDGTVWDPKISACNHIWAVERCGGNTNPSKNDSGTTASIDTETSTKSTTQHTTSSSSTSLTSTTLYDNNPCVNNGFVGDKYDCKKFYRCVGDGKGYFLRYEFSCGEGTVWDPKTESCNHAWAVDSCRDYASPVSAESSTISHPITMKDDNDDYNTQSNQEISSSTASNSWSSSTVETSAPVGDNKCKSEGFMADTQDCKKFYRCVNDGKGTFIQYEFSCGDGTIWDSEINSCNHIGSVKAPCSFLSTQTTEASRENETSVITTDKNNDYSTSSTPQKSQQCDQEGFFGVKNDCKKFYRCTDNGQGGYNKYEFSCGDGTVWDQEILACNHPRPDRNCSTNEVEESSESSISTSTSINLTESTDKPREPSFTDDQCLSEGFYANSNDCKKFFRCVDNGKGGFTKYDFTCGDGTVWVQDIQACDHDTDKSHCSKDIITTTTHSSQEHPVTTSTSSTTSATSSTSNPYSSTSADEYSTQSSHKPETDSESSGTTQASSTGSTSSSNINQDTCEESGYFGNSKDCKKFYRCVDNGKGGFTKYDYTCGEGTVWDQDLTTCNHPQDVSNPSCKIDGSQSTTTTTSANLESSKTTTTSSSTISSSTQSTTVEDSNQNPQEVSTNNPDKKNYTCTEAGFYPDPYDCKKFYRCVDWGGDGKSFSIFHFDCAEGTIWDPELQTCNHEESVYPPRDCSGTQSQNENNGTAESQGTTSKQEQTTEPTTSEGTTTSAQSTTQKSTSTTDQTSTLQSSTTERTSTTEKSTTQKSTTEQSTTQTEQSTSQQPTTEQSTTQQSTTEQSTTQQSTTQQSTTQQSTTEQSTTQQSTTEQSTTKQTTSTEQSTSQQTSTTQQPTTSEQSTSTTTEQSTTSTTTDQSTTTTEEATSTTTQSTTSETTTSSAEQTTKADQTTTTESDSEQTTENQSSTTEQSTTTQESSDGSSTTESGQDTTTEKESTDKECPEIDDDQYLYVCPTGFRRHPKYCNLFYQCTEDTDSHEVKVAVFNCPNNTIYDESKIQCVEEEKADKKCDGQIAQKRRVKRLDTNYKEPITVNRQKYSCPTVGHFPFEKNEECSPVLLKCEATKTGKLRGLVYQCPEGYVYWAISRRCEPVNAMTDCKRSYLDWSGRYEIPIERKNVARKK